MGKPRTEYEERKCGYSGCSEVFKPSRKWNKYHSPECQTLSYIERRKGKEAARFAALESRIAALESAIGKILDQSRKLKMENESEES